MDNLNGEKEMISQMKIDRETVENVKNDEIAHRIHFATSHSNSLRRKEGNSFIGRFKVPFSNTVAPFFKNVTGLSLYPNKRFGGLWHSIKNENDFEIISDFITKFKNVVFLRDTLALSMSLNFNKDEFGDRTRVGILLFKAKYHCDDKAIDILVKGMPKKVEKLPFYCDADVVCAVPSSHGFLKEIAASISHNFEMENISDEVFWENKKTGLKNLPIEEKWNKLEESNLIVDVDLAGKTVLLLDDLYQSGITMQFVAMKLQKAGADRIFGLSIVKSWKDTDNQ